MDTEETTKKPSLALIWTPILVLVALILVLMAFLLLRDQVQTAPLQDFDQMIVTDGFHTITLQSGQHFELSYEQNHDRYFDGIVRHTSMNHESVFPIVSFDILVTSGDYADEDLVWTSVTDHHFTWRSLNGQSPQGTINLLHTVPMDQATEELLMSIEVGDHIVVKGWDILSINGFSDSGEYIGTWIDAGCNTTLITEIYINPE
jgi:preprotein translocase subunit YajC